MGYALAQASLDRGAKVILVSGPVSLDPPCGAEIVRVQTAAEMRDAVFSKLEARLVIVDGVVPKRRRGEDVVELLRAGLHFLNHVVGHLVAAHVVAIDDEDATVLTAADQLMRILRRIVGHDDGRSTAEVGIVIAQDSVRWKA